MFGKSRARGFTVVELFVVIGVIAVLAGLLIPAAQSTREAARRALCLNNLKQLALATQNYHDALGSYPIRQEPSHDPRPLYTNFGCPGDLVDKSAFVSILAFLEQASLYNAINSRVSIYGPENTSIHGVVIGTLVCPSDSLGATPRPVYPKPPFGFALGNTRASCAGYVGSFGSLPVFTLPTAINDCKIDPRALDQANGVITGVSPIDARAITDGLSGTVMFAERSMTRLHVWNDRYFGGYGEWWSGMLGDTLFTASTPPNAIVVFDAPLVDAASSMHPNGLNVACCDGSARFVKNSINSWTLDPKTYLPVGAVSNPSGWFAAVPLAGVWQALATRNGGEVVASDSF